MAVTLSMVVLHPSLQPNGPLFRELGGGPTFCRGFNFFLDTILPCEHSRDGLASSWIGLFKRGNIMAPITSELATLRALTFRISSTTTAQLPQHVPAIVASLANCRTLLSSTQTATSKSSATSEASVAVHKYRTLLSTLLQDRTPAGRWSAIVLIKATIEVGGWETLQKCLPWVRGLLGILTKPDPPSSKKLCIITLTRIFILTREFPTLVREITTPSLPTFVQTCLQIANSKASANLLQTILESFNELLPRHPTIFRSYLKQIQPLLARLVAPTPSSQLAPEQNAGIRLETPSGVVAAAQRLFVQVACCAPKGASSEDWQKSLKSTILSAHKVADKVFRAVHEEWQTSTREVPSTEGQTLDDEVQDLEPDSNGLTPWSGIFAGSERLIQLLHLIQQHLDLPTANPIHLNLASIMDLVSRTLSLTVPATGGKAFQSAARLNNQVGKDERDNLWSILPDIHVATIDVILALAERSQSSTLALDSLILDQLTWVFGAEKDVVQVRAAIYAAVAALLQRSGKALPKSLIDTLVPVIRCCCDDMLPVETSLNSKEASQTKSNGNAKPQATANADSFLSASKSAIDGNINLVGLKEAANALLPVLLGNVKAQFFSDSIRARLDRTAILIQHKDAMMSSVLNPPPSKRFGKPAASILPIMARSFPTDSNVEGMLRPRMPVIRIGSQDTEAEDMDVDEEEDEEEEVEEDEEEVESTQPERTDDEQGRLGGQTLDTTLNSTGEEGAMAEETKETELAVRETEPPKDLGKRPLADEAPRSPSKRVKSREETLRATQSIPPPATPSAPVTRSSQRLAAPTTPSEFTATNTASAAPELPEPGDKTGEDGDSDDDDVIPLVFGQDTDDESE